LLLHPGSNTEAARRIANDLFHRLTDPAAAPHGYDLRINPRGGETLTELVPSRFSDFPDDRFGLAATCALSPAEFHRGRAALDGALCAAAAFSTDLATLIDVVSVTIALRKEPGVPTRFHSSTFRQYPGLVRLTNPHLDGVDTAILTEAIVHESIHSLLHIHEALESPFVSTAEGWDVAVTSPWSGSSILLHSYLHACFVWYGIYWLWHGLTDTGVLPEARRQTRLRFCLDGFARAPVSERLLNLRAHVRPGLFETLVDMETRMCCIR
jgi:HEXXH motif-containing protein